MKRIGAVAFIALAAAVAVAPSSVRADDLSIIINRADTFTEVYVSARAETLFATLDADTGVVPMQNGLVEYASFASGTWDIGDTLLKSATLLIDQQVAQLEAMSFMLHPADDKLRFETPLDGMISIGVCNALTSDNSYRLSDLTGYAGYYIDRDSTGGTMNLTLANPLPHDLSLTIFDYGAHTHTHKAMKFMQGTQLRITLDPPQQTRRIRDILPFTLVLMIGAMLLHILLTADRAQKHRAVKDTGLLSR